VISKSISDVICHGGSNGSVTVFAAGGSCALAYSIDNGTSYQAINQFTSLTAEVYKVTVRDVAGCTGSVFQTLHESSPISMGV